MENKYGIPEGELNKIRKRDKTCVYCHKKMMDSSSGDNYRKDWATIEHLNDLPPWNNPSTVAICCFSCNASRSDKKILDWFMTTYCTEKNINYNTVTEPVRDYIDSYEK